MSRIVLGLLCFASLAIVLPFLLTRLRFKVVRMKNVDDTFDVFISYGRKDANFARSVAELLMSNGLTVWFDEYQILFNNRELKSLLKEGVSKSNSAILITNADYAASPICWNEEAKPLLRRNPRIPILNIGRPAESIIAEKLGKIAMHSDIQSIRIDTFGEVVNCLEKFFQRDLVHDDYEVEPSNDSLFQWKTTNLPVSLNINGWQVTRGFFPLGPTAGPVLEQEIDGIRLHVNIIAGEMTMNRDEFRAIDPNNRWEYYEWAIALAELYVKGWSPRTAEMARAELGRIPDPFVKSSLQLQLAGVSMFSIFCAWITGSKGFGVHLFHHSSLNHLAVTSRTIMGWLRKYSVLVPNPNGRGDIELVFTCLCGGQFDDFCRYAHRFDEYVSSLQYVPDS